MEGASPEAHDASRKPERRASRRASILVLFAIVLVVLLGFTALVVDIGALSLAHTELAIALDAGALAGASQLDGTASGVARARASAIAVASMNSVRKSPVSIDASNIELGVWTGSDVRPSSDPLEIDAVRLRKTIEDVPTPFAAVAFASSASDVDGVATAIRPPPEPAAWTPCFLPVAIPRCIAGPMEDPGPPVRSFQLANDGQDNVGWAHPIAANANIVGNALYAAATGECAESDPRFEEGKPANLQNGVATTNLHLIRDLLKASAIPWQDVWGPKPERDEFSSIPEVQYPGLGVLQGPIAVIDEGGVACGDVQFNGSQTVDHLVWGVIFDVYDGPGSHKGFQILIDVGHDWTVPGGGNGSGNVNARPPGRLVE